MVINHFTTNQIKWLPNKLTMSPDKLTREKVRREKMAMAKENDLIPRGKKGSMNETAYFDKEDKRKNFTEGEY